MRQFDIEIPIKTWARSGGTMLIPTLIQREPIPDDKQSIVKVLEEILPGYRLEHAPFKTVCLPSAMRTVNSLFFDTVQRCYANHYALSLKPEVLGYLINYAIAIEVKADPETYRDFFTVSAGKETITINDDALELGGNSNWTATIHQFDQALRERVPSNLMEDMLPGYSTDTPVTRVASLVSFMDAASPYYDYRVRTMCGLPRITLLGELADWTKLCAAAKSLAPKFPTLNRFFSQVIPTLEKLVSEFTATTPDSDFWMSAFKYYGGSGTNMFDGWLSHFVSHLKDMKGNFILRTDSSPVEHGTTGTHVSTVPFIWDYHEKELPMVFAGGVMGVEIVDDALCPTLSFAILHDKVSS